MGEHNLLNPGFVGPLVNIHTGDTFYFPNFRASGGQLAGLPSLSYPRRDNVCSLPWNPSEPCNGYSQSYFSSPVSINPSFNRSCEITRADEGKCYYSNGGANRDNCHSGGGSLKREDRARDTSSSLTSEHGMHGAIGNAVAFSKYEYGSEQLTQDPPSCQSLESDSSSSLLNEGGKASASDTQTMVSPASHSGNIAAGGGEWEPHPSTLHNVEQWENVAGCFFFKIKLLPILGAHFVRSCNRHLVCKIICVMDALCFSSVHCVDVQIACMVSKRR